MSTELAVIDIKNPALVFVPQGLDPLLERIEKQARSELRDISTEKGRDNIRSLAFKIRKSKAALDKMGKDLGEEFREKIKGINSERNKAVDRLEALEMEIRAPLDEFENKEKARVESHESAIKGIIDLGVIHDINHSSETIEEHIKKIGIVYNREWEEFSFRAKTEYDQVSQRLNDMLFSKKKADAEAEELERLRAAEVVRMQKERDEKIASEAAAKAKYEAEERAKEEAEASLKREAEYKAAIERAEADKVSAVEAAAKAERTRLAFEQEKQRKDTEAREADKKHRTKINNDALSVLVKVVPDEELAKLIITAIARGEIPHIKIIY